MKKGSIFFLVSLTLLFVGFIAGMLVGRSTLRDPVTIQLPSETEKPTDAVPPGETAPQKDSDGRININTAHPELLDTLPGIGPVLAQRIVDYRDEHGPFKNVAELSKIEGIGNEKLMNIYDLITVED